MKKTKINLRWKVVIYFLLFSLLLYLIFWFTQQLTLMVFYRSNKIKSANHLTNDLVQIVEKIDIHQKIDRAQYAELFFSKTQEIEADAWILYPNGNSDLNNDAIIWLSNYPKIPSDVEEYWVSHLNVEGPFSDKAQSFYISGYSTKDIKGYDVMVLVKARYLPFGITQDVFSNQFMLITIIIILMGFSFAIIMQNQVVNPIVSLTKSAKQLAKGNFDSKFNAEGFDEIEELSDALNYAATELSKMDYYQKELMTNVSHDLKTPLTLIAGYGEMMRDFPDERTEENLQIIVDESKRLNGLVNDILSLTKIQIGSEKLEKEVYSLTESVREIVYRQQKLVESLGINITFNYETNVNIFANQEQMSKVIYNYISNAINYIGEDKQVIVNQTINNNNVTISVIDHGVGISDEDLPNIWHRYFKAKNHIRASVGSGLGLSIVRTVLEIHGFEYGVKSKVGEGSEFYFTVKIEE